MMAGRTLTLRRLLLFVAVVLSLGACGQGNVLIGRWIATSQSCFVSQLTFTDKTYSAGGFGTVAVSYDFDDSTARLKVESSPQIVEYTIVGDSVIRLKAQPECTYKKV
jgi:hypothetical protein